ncbi:MAG: FAD:protein FMN transferase [Bacteroidaceae bacterium]|nr:FAD:protein FMN transferase [Bacteroidaceae bacterium]
MKKWHYPFLAFLIIGTILILHGNKPVYRTNQGQVFGTTYKITYLYNEDLQAEIKASLAKVDSALSMFNQSSTIARINRNEDVEPDSMFLHIFRLAMKVSEMTDGAFDITVAPAVNAWGFGFSKSDDVTESMLDSLREIVGYTHVSEQNGRIVKDDARVMMDCSAIAKGFGCDVVAQMLHSKGIEDYMVEIGGEIVLGGRNPKGNDWSIGVNKPQDDTLAITSNLQTVLKITDCGMATSGNYRNFYYKDGRKVAHTIDPKSCMPVSHSLLSATVIAGDCATADALATSFMVMGTEKALEFLKEHSELRAYLIVSDQNGELQSIDLTEH